MKRPNSQGSLQWCCCLYLLVFVPLVCCIALDETLIVQPAPKTGLSSSGIEKFSRVPPPESIGCDLSRPRFDGYCYDELINRSLECESDLKGVGSLDTLCRLESSVTLSEGVSIVGGAGDLEIVNNATLSCAGNGCEILILLSGSLLVSSHSSIRGGTLTVQTANVTISENACLNTSALAGSPPPQTSGTPRGFEGAGGGHGGRGASCERNESVDQGGDVYKWDTLMEPWSYGSRGGTSDKELDLGGFGGGRVAITASDTLLLNGIVEANGGSVGEQGGGGSGGSVTIKAAEILGKGGMISASGGTGRGGGGGGRIAIDYERFADVDSFSHGGDSLGCPQNAGAAGTRFDVLSRSLLVSNNDKQTKTGTDLLAFPVRPLWWNVLIERCARIVVPLAWSRIQVGAMVKMLSGSFLTLGDPKYPSSTFELVSEDFVMENSTLTVYGAIRLMSKMLVMNNSKMNIIAAQDDRMVATSTVEASNFAYILEESEIRSNVNLGVHGQGLLELRGRGDSIKAQRLFLSLFYNVIVRHGALLQAPLEADSPIKDEITSLLCDKNICPAEVLRPSEDCNVNVSSPFTLQICRVEEINIIGSVVGSVVHIQRARSITIDPVGVLSASALGCRGGLGKGIDTKSGAGGGGGHGGGGGSGVLDDIKTQGGIAYGSVGLPCELGSGGGIAGYGNATAGGGMIVLGSIEHPVATLNVSGVLAADGESSAIIEPEAVQAEVGGPGGGSGGSLLFFLRTLVLGNGSLLSIAGGSGGAVGGGGGGGGRMHFHWSDIPTGEGYYPIASGGGSIMASGGIGSDKGLEGDNGTVSGQQCPRGLYGLFCEECPVGSYKNDTGSSKDLCKPCPPEKLPHRAIYIYVHGGVSEPMCPYQCMSEKYRMPHCYTVLEDLMYKLGGPYLFTLLLFCMMVTLALVLSLARMKLVGNEDFSVPVAVPHGRHHNDHSFPFLESLNEVLETNRVEESHSHIHRMYFMGSNSFGEPWHLPHSPPDEIVDFVYEDAFNRFVEELNSLAAYQWWEGSVHSILTVLAYPFAWSWQQWRRREKLQRLREYVRSQYDHACLRSCRSRALYEGLKVAATPDLMLAYIDVFLGGDEMRSDLPPDLMQRLPMSIIFGGDGSYLSMYSLHSDNLLTSLLTQAVPATMWYRLVAGVNAQLRTVRKGSKSTTLLPVIKWLETHANPWLFDHSVRVDLAWCQSTASGYYQLGLVLNSSDEVPQYFQPSDMLTLPWSPGSASSRRRGSSGHLDDIRFRRRPSWHLSPSYSSLGSRRRIGGSTLDAVSVKSLEDQHITWFPLSFLLRNIRPVGYQASVGLVMSLLLLADLSLTLLTLLQFYSIGIEALLVIVLVLPLAFIIPSTAGLNALFSHGSRRSSGLARVYALWNVTSIVNTLVALAVGFLHYKLGKLGPDTNGVEYSSSYMEEDSWWLLPAFLLLIKCVQARMIDFYIANLECHDRSLFAIDAAKFWEP